MWERLTSGETLSKRNAFLLTACISTLGNFGDFVTDILVNLQYACIIDHDTRIKCESDSLPLLPCPDGSQVTLIITSDCPQDNSVYSAMDTCSMARFGELCEGNGECGTDDNADNCIASSQVADMKYFYDVYRKVNSTTLPASSTTTACEKHMWWFGIGASLLFSAIMLQSVVYALQFEGASLILLRFVLCFLQVSPFVDLTAAFLDPTVEEPSWGMIRGELASKVLESAPQALFQSYIMFALGSYEDPLSLISIMLSVGMLSYSLVSVFKASEQACGAMKSAWGRCLCFAYLSADFGSRCMLFAVFLSEKLRPWCFIVMPCTFAAFFVFELRLLISSSRQNSFVGLVIFVALPYVGPLLLSVLDIDTFRQNNGEVKSFFRFIESGFFAALSFAIARTPCGERITWALGIFLFLWLLSNVILIVIRLCIDKDEGTLKRPKSSIIDVRSIIGVPDDSPLEDTE